MSEMIYTIGHKRSYLKGIEDLGKVFFKLGKCIHNGKPYPGGAVWATERDAREYLASRGSDLADYDVFGLLHVEWDLHTEQVDGEPFRRLLRDAQIVVIDQGPVQ